MMEALKTALRRSLKGSAHRYVGHMLFCVLFLVTTLFCVWFKSVWHEPLGVDGLVLSIVLAWIIYRAFPVIERFINK